MPIENETPHFRRWLLPLASFAPVLLGIYEVCTIGGPPDQGVGAAMLLGFILFPTSFIISIFAAYNTWSRWENWTAIDRGIGLSPLCIYLSVILFFGAYVMFAES